MLFIYGCFIENLIEKQNVCVCVPCSELVLIIKIEMRTIMSSKWNVRWNQVPSSCIIHPNPPHWHSLRVGVCVCAKFVMNGITNERTNKRKIKPDCRVLFRFDIFNFGINYYGKCWHRTNYCNVMIIIRSNHQICFGICDGVNVCRVSCVCAYVCQYVHFIELDGWFYSIYTW